MNESKRTRKSFSILTLLLIVTVCALGITVYTSNKKRFEIQTQFDLLSDTIGFIQIKNDTLVHVRNLHRPSPLVFTYQLVIPKGKKYRLNIGEGVASPNKPLDVLASTELSASDLGDNYLIQQKIFVNLRKTKRGWYVGFEHGTWSNDLLPETGGSFIDNDHLDWIDQIADSTLLLRSSFKISEGVRTFRADEIVYLDVILEQRRKSTLSTVPLGRKAIVPRTFAIWLELLQ